MADFQLDLSFPRPRVLRLGVSGVLDADAARVLLRAAAAAMHTVDRLELDLDAVSGFTTEGAWAIGACRKLSNRIADGVSIRTYGGTGRDLLVASCGAAV